MRSLPALAVSPTFACVGLASLLSLSNLCSIFLVGPIPSTPVALNSSFRAKKALSEGPPFTFCHQSKPRPAPFSPHSPAATPPVLPAQPTVPSIPAPQASPAVLLPPYTVKLLEEFSLFCLHFLPPSLPCLTSQLLSPGQSGGLWAQLREE